MTLPNVDGPLAVVPEFLSGGGEMGKRIREYDWSKTTLGAVDNWPQSLRTCIRIMLTSRQPIWIGWGKELIKFYNDPYKTIVGGKHPWALGTPASVVWKDIWQDIEPMLRQVMEKDEGTYVESQLLIMVRNGYPEETYYTFSYTPIPGDDGKTAGMFCANTDDTERITSERQLRTLTQLGKNLTDPKDNKDIIEKTIATLADNPYDFPFALFRTVENNQAILHASTDVKNAGRIAVKEVDLHSHNILAETLKKAHDTRRPQLLDGLQEKAGFLPMGAWKVSPDRLIVLPIAQYGKEPYGLLVVGLNPYRLYDDKYQSFFTLISDQVATSFADVHMLEEERRRAEALAEIDRAKTIFFSNISHEFRTPLTLLLGPIEESLNDEDSTSLNRKRMETAQRNALRMQKLVNTLLDFSRIEAGRLQGTFSKVDICHFTLELASTFRSAIEKAGMQLVFDCHKIDSEVYIDVDMWEKIVLNLVSNAFKYSKQGTIAIKIEEVNGTVEFAVTDTGVGIPGHELDKIFDRFHRVENLQGRSQEGTGIGLAMVKELVKLHNGSIGVTSELNKGSRFTVSIPTGKDHLPPEKLSDNEVQESTFGYTEAFVQEALKWLPGDNGMGSQPDVFEATPGAISPYKVLVADDNTDMREYVHRLLSQQFTVITAADGEEAFEKTLSHKPDLILSDIMMPRLDGFGLLKKLRGHLDTANTPVIFLSARAGEEAKVEGLDAGADDYLVKPFSAKELLAKVSSQIKINQLRNNALHSIYNLFYEVPFSVAVLKGKDLVIEFINQHNLEIWQRKKVEVVGKPLADVFPGNWAEAAPIHEYVYSKGQRYVASEIPIELKINGKSRQHYFNAIIDPLKNERGEIIGQLATSIDVTDFVLARKKIEESEAGFRQLADAVPQLVWVADPNGDVIYYNNRITEFSGATKTVDGKWRWEGVVHKDDRQATEQAWNEAVANRTTYQAEHRIQLKDGSYRWFLSRAYPQKDEEGNVIKWFGTATDVHSSKEQSVVLEEEVIKRTHQLQELNLTLQQSNNELQQFAHVASHDLKEPLRKIKTFSGRLTHDFANNFSEKAHTYLDKINSAADRMNSMIEGVLKYSMLNATDQKVTPVDLNEIIQDIETDLEVLIAQKSATLRCHDLPVVEGAPVLLYQLFYNLINNSLKFSRDDIPSAITISSTVRNKEGRQEAEIQVTDNGIGFRQEFAERIFETFSRLNSKDQFEGTGLGLSLCKRIAERHDGNIQAFSEPGAGATFVVTLPLELGRKNL